MEIIRKRSVLIGIMLLIIPSMHCIDYEKQCDNIYLNNKTHHRLIISFCNEDHNEQQQFIIEPGEHLSVRVSAEMVKKLGSVRVVMADRKKKQKHKKGQLKVPKAQPQVRELDYDRGAGIVGLEMAMISGELDLKWRYSNEYAAAQVPRQPQR
jgi:hypothetical protein